MTIFQIIVFFFFCWNVLCFLPRKDWLWPWNSLFPLTNSECLSSCWCSCCCWLRNRSWRRAALLVLEWLRAPSSDPAKQTSSNRITLSKTNFMILTLSIYQTFTLIFTRFTPKKFSPFFGFFDKSKNHW